MKIKTLCLALLSFAVISSACKRKDTASQQLDTAIDKTAATAKDMKNYAFAQKAEFSDTMRRQLDGLDRDLDELTVKFDKSGDTLKAEAQPKIKALRDQTARLHKQLEAAQSSTESSWESTKTDFKDAYDASSEGIRQARQWASDKIAP